MDFRVEFSHREVAQEINELDPKATTVEDFRAVNWLEGPLVTVESVNEKGELTKALLML